MAVVKDAPEWVAEWDGFSSGVRTLLEEEKAMSNYMCVQTFTGAFDATPMRRDIGPDRANGPEAVNPTTTLLALLLG